MTNADHQFPVDMQAGLAEFEQRADEIFKPFATSIEARPNPSRIYHYTNDVGLQGILRSGALWLSDIFDLNDPSELRHGFSQATDILKELAASGPPEAQRFALDFERFLTDGGIEDAAHYFVCCFSKESDELGQWRAYADNGRGYSLGFDATALESAYMQGDGVSKGARSDFPITYDDAQLAALQRPLFKAAMPLISLPAQRSLVPKQIRNYMQTLSEHLSRRALLQVLAFKHPGYKNEAEYRFLQIFPTDQPVPEVLYRSRPYSLIRYREFNWRSASPRMLSSITIGPAADPIKGPQYARDCLRAFHPFPDSVEIVHSEIPYRAV